MCAIHIDCSCLPHPLNYTSLISVHLPPTLNKSCLVLLFCDPLSLSGAIYVTWVWSSSLGHNGISNTVLSKAMTPFLSEVHQEVVGPLGTSQGQVQAKY